MFGRRSSVGAVIGIGVMCLFLQGEQVHGAEYIVGDEQGWDLYPEVNNWGKDKHFKPGDVLIFKYSNSLFRVASVDREGYERCKSKEHLKKLYETGNDRVVLEKGSSYFICDVMDYCGYGMRIAITAG